MVQRELRLSGSGGQGLILAGIILAEAALSDGKHVVQSQSYGPEARGGASKAEVIISEKEINYPKVRNCDVLLALTQVACDKYIDSLKKGGSLIIDSSVRNKPNREDIYIYTIPILETAENVLNRPMVANMIALGSLNGLIKVVDKVELEKAVLNRVPKGTETINKAALEEGFKLITRYEGVDNEGQYRPNKINTTEFCQA
ncbi:2-oxoacid:acceptor oxidoreductase family protein [Anaerosalibacter massiliensis]|uniref:2-oxoacid:acceptor oxidoreductase family protein n=1 Tax=Anaerosalibacter massiliensis TaxID=1347392 RepID=A0A9X2MFJ5_9FIRM|nr:2-oxoacid:acceptor oxidoreductase family protein [Anaerosalibacter massiliensis]MCR2042656.1 2-oxoacid:acceptor oxidoreductase family protein [Anaerosalibacter massiliensis]